MKQVKRITAAWLSVLMFASVLIAAPAGASDLDVGIDSAEEVEEAIEETLAEVPVIEDLVEETQADVADLEIDENADVVVELETDEGATVEIPAEADQPIVLEGADGDEAIEVGLPGSADDADVLDDGSVVFEDAAADTDLVVQAQEDGGVRVLAVLDGADAPNRFDFEGEQELILFDDGSAMALDEAGEPVAQIPAPWAYDADGNEVPSWYTADGTTLTLHIEHSAVTAYPVVADPQYRRTWYGLVTYKFNSSETNALSQALGTASHAGALTAAYCAGIGVPACSFPASLAWAALGVGRIAVDVCSNNRGVDIHLYRGAIWCSGY